MVDEGVRVIGPARQHHGEAAGFLRLRDNGLPGLRQRPAEGGDGRRPLAVGLLRLLPRGAAVLRGVPADLPPAVLLRKPVEHRRLKGHGEVVLRGLEVPHHHGVAHDDRADVGALLPLVFRGHVQDIGQEDPVRALLRQVQHMAVDQLGRETDGVRRHVLQPALVLLPAAGMGELHRIPQCPEEGGPEGHAVPELQHPGQSHGLPLCLPHRGDRILFEQQLLPQPEQIRHSLRLLGGRRLLRHHGAPVAPVAGDIAPPVRESQDGPAAVVGAVGAEHAALPGVCKVPHRVKADEGGAAAVGVAVGLHLLLHRESRAQGAHLAGVGRQRHLPAQILLQGPEDGEVPEGAPLDHHPVPPAPPRWRSAPPW